MRFYQYNASDATGKVVRGTIQSNSAQEAMAQLRQHNLRVESITELNSGGIVSPPAPQQPVAPRKAPVGSMPVSRPASAPVPQVSAPSVAPAPDVIHTVMGSDKERMFIFSQLAAALRAGINPAQAFSEIGQRSKPYYTKTLKEAGDAAVEGRPVSTVFARYPDLYPEHVVGVVRAAELGGFLPEGFDEISRHAESAHAFKRWFFWVWFVAINALLSIPGMWITTRMMLGGWENIDKKGGTNANGQLMSPSEGLAELTSALVKQLIWPWGPLTLLFWFIVWLIRRYFGSRIARRTRHRLGLKLPVFGPRARHENLARFAWTMSRVSKIGVPPARAWQAAAESVQNLEMRDRLVHIGSALSGQEKMSDIVFRSQIFPDEYAPVVATAEYTGDLPGALDQLSRMSNGEFQSAQNYAKARSGCWGALGCFMTSAIMLGMLWYAWYHELPAKVLDGLEP